MKKYLFYFLIYSALILNTYSASTSKSIVSCGSLILGGSENGKWVSGEDILSKIKTGDSFSLYNNDGFLENVKVTKTYIDSQHEAPSIEFDKYGYFFDSPELPIAVSASFKIIPRKPFNMKKYVLLYNNLAKWILSSNGVEVASPVISQIYKVDLEGDGNAETIMTISNQNFENCPPNAKINDYSAVIMRKKIKGKAENILIEGDFYNKSNTKPASDSLGTVLYQHRIIGFFDLNGDGKLEIVTANRYSEGFGFSVYEIKRGKAVLVLSNSWGM